MAEDEFKEWLEGCGVHNKKISYFLDFLKDYENPYSFIYNFNDIYVLNTDTDYPIHAAAVAEGFLIIGGCGNGDPIALNRCEDDHAVYYIGHEELDDETKVKKAVVAKNLEAYKKMEKEESFPYDYYDAID